MLTNKHELILDELAIGTEDLSLELDPDTPIWVRRINEILARRPDEILTTMRLSHYDLRLTHRKTKLVKLESEIATLALSLQYKTDELGKQRRQIRVDIQRQHVQTVHESVINSFVDSLKNINRVGEEFKDSMNGTIQQISEQYQKVLDQYN